MRIDGSTDTLKIILLCCTGQWFGFSDSSNKIYANLIVHDGGSKPTENSIVEDQYNQFAGFRNDITNSSILEERIYHQLD